MEIMGDRMDLHERILTASRKVEHPPGRPFVTLSYAQSLDGSIAAGKGERTHISGPESAKLTHILRADHDAILIGIGTLLVDDPQLTVRLVEGDHPRPVILDSKLRMPIDSVLMQSNPPWIVTAETADQAKAKKLTSMGAKLIYLPESQEGYLHLLALMESLHREGIRRLMVEGGARVLASFLESQLVDFVVVIISPLILGGLPAVHFKNFMKSTDSKKDFPRLDKMNTGFAGEDLVVFGQPHWIVKS